MPTSVLSCGPGLQASLNSSYDPGYQPAPAMTSQANWNTSQRHSPRSARETRLPSVTPWARTPPADLSPEEDAFTRPRMPALKRPKIEDDDGFNYGIETTTTRDTRTRNLSIGELSNSSDTLYPPKPDQIGIGRPDLRDASQRPPDNNSSTPGSTAGCTRCSALEPLMQDAARSLTKLTTSLRSGLQAGPDQLQLDRIPALNLQQCPRVSEVGLAPTLLWMLDALESTHLFVPQVVAAGSSFIKNETRHSTACDPDQNETMKRHMPSIRDGDYKRQLQETTLRPELRRSSTTGLVGDELPPISSRTAFTTTTLQSPFVPRTGPSMDPPHHLGGRQLPSPPSRSQQSPPRYGLSSPSSNFRAGTLPPPSSVPTSGPHSSHQPLTTPNLQSVASNPSIGAVAHAHSAALQHEISLRTLQLQSLQAEHESLLAAYSRSENRAADLERKHALTDAEVAGLQEERMQLQTKILELEQNLEELSKSRNHARQAAVQEGAQYVKIVKMASRLEEMAARERKTWNESREKMEKRISVLQAERDEALARVSGDHPGPASGTSSLRQELLDEPAQIRDLQTEVGRLKRRCRDFETALVSVRSDSRLLENTLDSLFQARRRISDRVEQTLESTEDTAEEQT